MSNKCKIMAGLAAAVLAVGKMASADTISVHDYINSSNVDVNINPVQDGTTTVAGKTVPVYEYQYDINADNQAYIQANDGFVIYDFNGFVSGSLSQIPGESDANTATLVAGFNPGLEIQLTGTGSLNDPTDLSGDLPPAHYTDLAGVPNVVYAWTGSLYDPGVTENLLLTLLTTDGATASGFTEGIDFSGSTGGSGGGADTQFAISNNPVIVPTSVPTPTAWLGGSALFALLGISRILKARRLEA